ncbi:MAG: energy transducer TonB [Deltaproteobacteria bacterium]|nr:energy transducer TonB [Deltaproteobacteria bacterium]
MFSAMRQDVEPELGCLRFPIEVFEVEQQMFLPIARPTFTAAVFSCVLHICALGLASVMMLTQSEHVSTPMKVVILQPAVPLPVGEKTAREVKAPEPVAPPSPPPAAKPVEKTKKPLPPPEPRVKKPPPPQVVKALPPPEPAPQPAALTLPATGRVAPDGSEQNSTASTNGTTSTASGERSGTQTAGGKNEAGRSSEAGGTSAQPDYSVNPKPPYPMLARRRGEQGTVLLRVRVRADGSVAEAEVKQSSGSTLLDDTALRTVRDSWRFTPARLNGMPMESWVEVPIRFVLGKA